MKLTLATINGEPTDDWQKLPADVRYRREAKSSFEWYCRLMTSPDRLDDSGLPTGRLRAVRQ